MAFGRRFLFFFPFAGGVGCVYFLSLSMTCGPARAVTIMIMVLWSLNLNISCVECTSQNLH